MVEARRLSGEDEPSCNGDEDDGKPGLTASPGVENEPVGVNSDPADVAIVAPGGNDVMIGVLFIVRVGRVSNLLGGATLSNHCVVPFITEK